MEDNTLFKQDLILTGVQATGHIEVINTLAALLYDNGYVKDTFADAIVKREGEFPTGLGGIAIPHTDRVHILKDAIAVAVLDKPVDFVMMGTEEELCSVSVVFMLAISTDDKQIETLQTVMGFVQSEESLDRIKKSDSAENIYQILMETLA